MKFTPHGITADDPDMLSALRKLFSLHLLYRDWAAYKLARALQESLHEWATRGGGWGYTWRFIFDCWEQKKAAVRPVVS